MTMRRKAAVLMVLLLAACSRGEGANEQVQANSDMMGNGMMPNGMMTNGMMTNGMMANGMMSDQPSSGVPADQNAAENEHAVHHEKTVTTNE